MGRANAKTERAEINAEPNRYRHKNTRDTRFYGGGLRLPIHHCISWEGGMPSSPLDCPPGTYEGFRPSNH